MGPHDQRPQVVLITGASSGIGEACAEACSARGMPVALLARRAVRLQAIVTRLEAAGRRAVPIVADVTSEDDVHRAVHATVEALGHLDVMICNAGIGYYGPVEGTSASAMARLLDVNVMGSFHAAQAALQVFRRQGSGHLIFVSSIVGRRAVPGSGAYAASKFGQTGLAEALRVELLGSGIHVSTIFPVSTETEFRDAARREFGHTAGGLGPRQPAHRVAREVVDLIERPRPERYPHRASRLLAIAAVVAPRWCDKLVQRFERRRTPPRATGSGS